jgi:hypothetical protein
MLGPTPTRPEDGGPVPQQRRESGLISARQQPQPRRQVLGAERLVRQQRAEASGNGTATVRRARVTIGSSRVNFTFTAESRAKISESVRKRWQDPTYRARRSNISVSQETRAKLSEAMKAKWLSGSYRERNGTSNAHSAERRSKIAAAIRAKWAEPEYRERATIGIRLARLNATASRRARGGVPQVVSEEVRAKLSMTMKHVWAQRREKDLSDRVAAELSLAEKEGREPRLTEPLPRRVHRVHNGVLSSSQWRPPQRGGAVTSLGVSGTRAAGMQERRPESLAEDASTAERWQAMAMEEAIETLGARRITADIDPDNGASIRVFETLGFTLEARLRGEWEMHIGVRDTLIYGLLRDDDRPWRNWTR